MQTQTPFLLLIIILFISYLHPIYAQAQTTQGIINQQDWITRNQQNKVEENKREKEQEAIKKERDRKKKLQENIKQNISPSSKKASSCFTIKEIKLSNASSISKKYKNKLTKTFIGECFDGKTLSKLVEVISAYYNDRGFVTARIVVPKQNIKNGILQLNILEGRVDKVIVGKNSLTDKMQQFTAFGNIEGDVLNIEDINQGLYQINRLQSNNATLKIEPSDDEGGANVIIVNDKKFPARATIVYDNLGNDFTGIRRTTFSGSLDNLLFLNDNINLSYSTNLNDDSKFKDIKSFSSSFSIPFGRNIFYYDYSRSEFKGTSSGIERLSKFTGYSDRNNIAVDRLLLNKGNLRISGNAAITTKKSASYFDGSKLENSERKLTIGSLGFAVSNYFKNGVNLYLKPSYLKGLKLLNTKKDEKGLARDAAKAQFEAFKIYASISKNFIIPAIKVPILLSTEIDSQIARDTLFGSEQFSVGGYYSVQGFRENYITADSGYYLRNKANVNLGSLILPFLNKEKTHNYLSYLNKFKLEPFYDYGYVKTHYDNSSGRLSGAGLKTLFESKYFNASLTYSWAINKSQLIASPKKENKMVYFEINTSCC
jgi:hemolysin activation/secretion protein